MANGIPVSHDTSYYDDYGNMIYKKTDVGEEEYLYDNASRVVGYRDARDFGSPSLTESIIYDGFGRITSSVDRVGNKQQVQFESLSKEYSFLPKGSTISENHYTENYDIYGNVVETKIYPDGLSKPAITTGYEYDLVGNLLKLTDGNGKKTSYQYDKLNRVTQITKADKSVVETKYSKFGSPTAVTEYEESQKYSIYNSYDDRGLTLSTERRGLDIDTRPWYYEYRKDGRISKVTEPNGNIKEYGYDESGNMTGYHAGSELKSLYYNHFGQLDKVTRSYNGENTETADYVYNDKEWLTAKVINGKTTGYDYNAVGSLTELTTPSSHTRLYGRDDLERVKTVKADDKTFTYEYYDDGMIKAVLYPTSGIRTDYTYDNANRLKTMVTKKGSTILKNYEYEYDKVGNIVSVSGSDDITYTYDDLYRLKTWKQNRVTTTYTYDSRNNLKSETRPNYSKTYEYSGDNRLSQVTENGTVTIYDYDLNGNLISESNGNEYAYDENNKMVYSKVSGVETTYKIGMDGLRESKTTNGVTKGYEIDEAGKVITETDGANATAEIINGHQSLAKEIDGVYYYYIYNGHGDVVALVDENGNVKNTYSYDPWGKISSQSETVENDIKYAGEHYDAETGLIYLRARYYDPATSRMLSEDPMRDGTNWYVYANNNPIRYKDPTGYWAEGDELLPAFIQEAIKIYTEQWESAAANDDIYGMTEAYGAAQSARALAASLVTRDEWGATGEDNKWGADPDKNTIVVHHTDNNDSIKQIENKHIDKGYGTVGYHFVIAADGNVYEGTPLGNKGAHVDGANTGKIGISLIGDFEPDLWDGWDKTKPTEAQLLTMIRLIRVLQDVYGISTVNGHNDFNNTECPGDVLDEIIERVY